MSLPCNFLVFWELFASLVRFLYICITLRVKAIILIFIFLLGGNGLSVDIAKCCDNLAGISLGFAKSEAHKADESCCPVFKTIKPGKMCCENMVISTVINHVPGLSKTYKSLKKPLVVLNPVKVIASSIVLNEGKIDNYIDDTNDDANYPIPILLKKRVLTI